MWTWARRLGSIAELIPERIRAGLSAARHGGQGEVESWFSEDDPRILLAKKMYEDRSLSAAEICASLKISRATYYRYLSL
jgi:DNA invertase Pin-like site-specific DNA recombinase